MLLFPSSSFLYFKVVEMMQTQTRPRLKSISGVALGCTCNKCAPPRARGGRVCQKVLQMPSSVRRLEEFLKRWQTITALKRTQASHLFVPSSFLPSTKRVRQSSPPLQAIENSVWGAVSLQPCCVIQRWELCSILTVNICMHFHLSGELSVNEKCRSVCFRMFLNPAWCLQGSLQQTSTKVNSMLPEQKILQITPDCFEA